MALGRDFITGDGYELPGAPQFPSGTFDAEAIKSFECERSAYFHTYVAQWFASH